MRVTPRTQLCWLLAAVVVVAGCTRKPDTELLAAARAQLEARDHASAIVTLKDALQHNEGLADGRLLLGRALLETGDPAAALLELRKAQGGSADAQALAPLLIETTGLTPVILGGPADTEAAARIAAADPRIVNLAGKTRLPEAVAVIAHSALLIGVDTGLTHMGTALARPTVAIFGSTCPYTDTGRPTGSVIWLGMECSPCRRRPTCGGKFTCLRDITPAMVLERARAMLAAGGAAP